MEDYKRCSFAVAADRDTLAATLGMYLPDGWRRNHEQEDMRNAAMAGLVSPTRIVFERLETEDRVAYWLEVSEERPHQWRVNIFRQEPWGAPPPDRYNQILAEFELVVEQALAQLGSGNLATTSGTFKPGMQFGKEIGARLETFFANMKLRPPPIQEADAKEWVAILVAIYKLNKFFDTRCWNWLKKEVQLSEANLNFYMDADYWLRIALRQGIVKQ